VAFDYLSTVAAVEGVKALNLAISFHDGEVDLELKEGRRLVPCRSLDSLAVSLTPPDLVYVGSYGYEIPVLTGAEFLMVTSAPSWIIEMRPEQRGRAITSFLSKYGYNCEVVPSTADPLSCWIKAVMPRSSGD
jgi:hypothetical protein